MKVLVLSTKLPYPAKDGGAIATLSLATGLAETGIDVTMLSFNTKKHFFPPEKIPAEILKSINIHTIDIDTSIQSLKALFNLFFSSKPYISERFYKPDFSKKLIELLTDNDFKIVQMEGPYFAQYLPLIRKYSNASIALRAHNIEHEIWDRIWKNEARPLKKIYLRNLARRIRNLEEKLLKNIDLLIPISDRDGELMVNKNPGLKSITIPAGIDLSRYKAKPSVPNRDIFFIGALDWAPNQEGIEWFMKKVMPHLSIDKKPVTFHIAGRNAPEEFIRSIFHPSVKYHGEVENAIEYMNKYDIMAVPLLSGSGIRIKILEGMALGKCIVTTSIGIEGIPAEDGKHLLLGDDGKTFAKQLLTLLENRNLANSMSADARKLVQEKFDTFTIASKLGDLYKNIV